MPGGGTAGGGGGGGGKGKGTKPAKPGGATAAVAAEAAFKDDIEKALAARAVARGSARMTRSSSLRAVQQPVVSHEFDATLGFPGEGPSELATLLVVAYADASFDRIVHHVEPVEAESPQGSRTQR